MSNYDEAEQELDFENDSGVLGYEIAYGTGNKVTIKKKSNRQYDARHKVELLKEKRRFEREVDSLSDYWDDNSF